MNNSSTCCKYISANIPDMGDPNAIPFLGRKIDTFIQENNIMMLSKDPTESYQKLLQKLCKNAKT